MRISLLKVPDPSAGSWVIQDSAEALVELGHRVDVVKLGFATKSPSFPPLIKGDERGISSTLKFLYMN